MALSLGLVGTAHAASFYWYGQGGSTCWQTGQLGAPSEACGNVGAGYLATPGHNAGGVLAYMVNASESGQSTSTSGLYCVYYRIGDNLIYQDSNNEASWTGFETPTPFSSWQEGDGHNNVCQADGSHWGQEVRDSVSGNGCNVTCGMHQYVSYGSQGTNERPWSGTFGEPSLALSVEAGVHTFTHTGSYYGGWGYVCPLVEDVSTHGVLEYCFQEWRSANNSSEWKDERIGECAGSLAMINTYFWPGTSYATEMAGSTNTFEVGSYGSGHFEARITEANLKNAIKLANSGCAGWHISENPENYALIGIEQGLEGWDGVSVMGGWGANLQLHTEYTPLPPEGTTSPATEVQETQVKLNGTVNPKGTDTHYYFQYGETTSYGLSTPAPPGNDAGSGTSGVPVSATATGLEGAAVTYHYRIVAQNADGTTYGSDETFRTASKPSAVLQANGEKNVFYDGSNGTIWEWDYHSPTWTDYDPGGSPVGSPSSIVGKGFTDTFYRGTNGTIWNLEWNGSEFIEYDLGGSPAGDPSAVLLSGGGDDVFYRGTNGAIWGFIWNGTGWTNTDLGGSAAGTPSAVQDSVATDVYYRGTDGTIYLWEYATKWTDYHLGGLAAGDPSAVALSGGGEDAFYRGTNGAIWGEIWTGSGWASKELGGSASGTPSAVVGPSSIDVYYRGTDATIWDWEWNGTKWTDYHLGGSAAGSPSALLTSSGGDDAYYQATNGTIWGQIWNGTGWTNTEL